MFALGVISSIYQLKEKMIGHRLLVFIKSTVGETSESIGVRTQRDRMESWSFDGKH